MSWWVYLEDRQAAPWCSYGSDKADACESPCYPAVDVECHAEVGAYMVGGIGSAELNVTYNYGGEFHRAWDAADYEARKAVADACGEGGSTLGLMLHERCAREVMPLLERAVAVLGEQRDPDYWKPTPGNAGHALCILLQWARQHPDAVFRVS